MHAADLEILSPEHLDQPDPPQIAAAGGDADTEAETLVMDHQDLVEIATNFVGDPWQSPTIDRDDLIGEGQVALIKAAHRYDPDKGSFRSYAFTRIKGAMIDALRRDFLLPRSARERGESVTVVSIDKPIGDGELTLSDTIEDARYDVEEIVANRAQLASAIEERAHEIPTRTELTPMELEVLRGAAVGETAGETADRLGKSHETVRSQRRTALKRLGARSIAHAVFIARDDIAA